MHAACTDACILYARMHASHQGINESMKRQSPSDINAPAAFAGSASDPHPSSRQRWMAILARADKAELEQAWRSLKSAPEHSAPEHQWLRRPETGLTMLRARTGGTGMQFNLAEASVTRCTLRLTPAPGLKRPGVADSGATDSGATDSGVAYTGVAYILGRDHRHAELAALFDALLQDEQQGPILQQTLIRKLASTQAARRKDTSRKAAATRVDFYTMVRGNNP